MTVLVSSYSAFVTVVALTSVAGLVLGGSYNEAWPCFGSLTSFPSSLAGLPDRKLGPFGTTVEAIFEDLLRWLAVTKLVPTCRDYV